jgi:hypothetical protein
MAVMNRLSEEKRERIRRMWNLHISQAAKLSKSRSRRCTRISAVITNLTIPLHQRKRIDLSKREKEKKFKCVIWMASNRQKWRETVGRKLCRLRHICVSNTTQFTLFCLVPLIPFTFPM